MRSTLLALPLAACTAADYVAEADVQVYGILERAAEQVTGETKAFDVVRPENTLRRRLLEQPGEIRLDLQTALDVAAENSREFQTRKEALYLTALDLTQQQLNFSVIFGGGGNADATGVADRELAVALSDDLSAAANTTAGTRIVASFVNTFLRSVVNGGNFEGNSILDLTITQPLLRGFGSRIAREPLTQAERNVIYEVRAFERFRRTFAVRVTSSYYLVARQFADLQSENANYSSVSQSREQIEALFEASRRTINDVDQARQNELNAENRLIEAQNRLQLSLDNFKLTLGLPISTPLEVDVDELKRLAALGVQAVDLDEETCVEVALARRYDYQTVLDRVVDAARGIRITKDALRSSLDFSTVFTVPTHPDESLDFDWSQMSWAAGFDLDLALNRIPERNAYRAALITIDVRIRAREELEDTIRADLRTSLRDIQTRLQSYDIQRRAVTLAERRVDSTTELYDAGLAQARDILEAQAALLNARLGLNGALVDYAIARLELMRDLEAIAIEPKGLRYDRSLPLPLLPDAEPAENPDR